MSELFETAIIEKRNVLNEIRASNLTLQELRFFSIYLSKINPRDENTRSVKFPFADFKKIMDFGKLNIQQLKNGTYKALYISCCEKKFLFHSKAEALKE